jgi:hypothetical protein
MRSSPEILDVNNTQLEDVLRRIEGAVDEKDFALIRALFQSYTYVAGLVEDKNTSIRRLRQLFFGKRTEKTKNVVGSGDGSEATPPETAPPGDIATDTRQPPANRSKNQQRTRAARHLPAKATAATAPTPIVALSGSMFRSYR